VLGGRGELYTDGNSFILNGIKKIIGDCFDKPAKHFTAKNENIK
jgi:hypothetical protein